MAALLVVAARCGSEERARLSWAEHRGHDDEDEADRIAREHGFSSDRLIALRGLARSRGVELDVVLRHALSGELRAIVERPPARPGGR